MGECILYGNGGGAGLNFKVVGGTTEPSNPVENMIWVNTDVEITGWTFSTNNPYAAESDNLYVTATNSYYITIDGGSATYTGWKSTGYIELPDNTESITITMGSTTSEAPSHAFYNASKNFLSAVYRKPGTTVYTVPKNTKYIRMSEYNNESVTLIATYGGTEKAENGAVWFLTGTPSNAPFNALKKNSIKVYLLSAKQYIDDVLVDVEAKIYQDNEWVDLWTGQLFNNGNQWESITGGWINAEQINTSYSTIIPIEVSDTIYLNTGSSAVYRQCAAITKNKIDTTGYTAVEADISSFSTGTGYEFVLYILSGCSANSWAVVAQKSITATGTSSISITTPGNYHIAIAIFSTKGTAVGFVDITEVRLVE